MNHYFTGNENLKSELRVLKYSYLEYNFLFKSDLGVFSKDRIDTGSKTLVETYFKHGQKNAKILDAGAGYGFVGITLAKVMGAFVDMIDINARSLHLCKQNIKDNSVIANVFESDVYEAVTEKYDCIITNPPIRAGKSVYMKFIIEAFDHLNKNGELWFVMRTNHGVKTVVKTLKETKNVKILCKNNGFYVISAKHA